MYIVLTGTPGTGKTSAAKVLASRGYAIITVEELAKKHECLDDANMEVDTDALALAVQQPNETVILEGHLAHFLPGQITIVLRCHPEIIRKRLTERGYDSEKILENVEAEAIDLILSEAMEHSQPVFEIDVSELSPEEIADIIETIMNDRGNNYSPGKVDWSTAVMEWY